MIEHRIILSIFSNKEIILLINYKIVRISMLMVFQLTVKILVVKLVYVIGVIVIIIILIKVTLQLILIELILKLIKLNFNNYRDIFCYSIYKFCKLESLELNNDFNFLLQNIYIIQQ